MRQPSLGSFEEVEEYFRSKVERLEQEVTSTRTLLKDQEAELARLKARLALAAEETRNAADLAADGVRPISEGSGTASADEASVIPPELTKLLTSDADISKKARGVALHALARGGMPMNVREMMNTFPEFDLDLDPDNPKEFDLVRAAMKAAKKLETRKKGRINYYWFVGREWPSNWAE